MQKIYKNIFLVYLAHHCKAHERLRTNSPLCIRKPEHRLTSDTRLRSRLVKVVFWHDLPAVVFDHSHITRAGHSWFSITHLETTDIHRPCIPLPRNCIVAVTHVNPLMVGLYLCMCAVYI